MLSVLCLEFRDHTSRLEGKNVQRRNSGKGFVVHLYNQNLVFHLKLLTKPLYEGWRKHLFCNYYNL